MNGGEQRLLEDGDLGSLRHRGIRRTAAATRVCIRNLSLRMTQANLGVSETVLQRSSYVKHEDHGRDRRWPPRNSGITVILPGLQ